MQCKKNYEPYKQQTYFLMLKYFKLNNKHKLNLEHKKMFHQKKLERWTLMFKQKTIELQAYFESHT
jgi:hypothetical protein